MDNGFDADPDYQQGLDGSEIWLAGEPVSKQALQDAAQVLVGFDDVELPDQDVTPPWVIAARLAVEEALNDA